MTIRAEVMPPDSALLLLSADYDEQANRIRLRLYDEQAGRLHVVYRPAAPSIYCYTKTRRSAAALELTKTDLASDAPCKLYKEHAKSPSAMASLAASSSSDIKTYESDIRAYENYLYDHSLICGCHYRFTSGNSNGSNSHLLSPVDTQVTPAIGDSLGKIMSNLESEPKQYRQHILMWARLLSESVPDMRRAAVDIEISMDGRQSPDMEGVPHRVTAIGIHGSDIAVSYVLDPGCNGRTTTENVVSGDGKSTVQVIRYSSEAQMISDAIARLSEYPIILTYYGDEFDLPYLYRRASKIGAGLDGLLVRSGGSTCTTAKSIHLDLYRFLKQASIQNYAFSHRYSEFSLDAVCRALLGEEKTGSGSQTDLMDIDTLAAYCHHDAYLTYRLTTFADNILLQLMVMISRISKLPLDIVCRTGVSTWIKSMLYCEHRQTGAVIPRADELQERVGETADDAIMAGKKYRGGLVLKPEPGVHFGVTVMDFASLYPSIIKVKNVSYETIRCVHEECRGNIVPGTHHWSCTKKMGMLAGLVGSLKELRVSHFKPLASATGNDITETERSRYDIIAQALKVILNAASGAMGFESFPLYFLPTAEVITSAGRQAIADVADRCRKLGVGVLYGDTDSVFVKCSDEKTLRDVMRYAADTHRVDLEIDKQYRYVVLSDRKKNYFGVTTSGKVDVKGLAGKKSNTPAWVRSVFSGILDTVSRVSTHEEFDAAKSDVQQKIRDAVGCLYDNTVPVDSLAYNVKMSRATGSYTKSMPQHVRAAKRLEEATGTSVSPGDTIRYVKTQTGEHVAPVELAHIASIDRAKYVECLSSVLAPVIEPMDMDMDVILGHGKQIALERYFQ